jgi:GNAT superfamily N-acetyltransferase
MRIVQWAAGDAAATRACYEVARSAARHDDPDGAPTSERVFLAALTPMTEPAQTWFVPGDAPDTAQGYCHLRLPVTENRNRARLTLSVHPERRRRGIGRALLAHAMRLAADNERSVVGASVLQGTAGEEFARHFGGSPGLADARRVLVLATLLPGQVAGCARAPLRRRPAGSSSGRRPARSG